MLKKWKRSVDRGKIFGALLTDLSKVLNSLDHELLMAKLNAYGFSLQMITYQIGDSDLELKIRLVIGLKLYLEYLKGR